MSERANYFADAEKNLGEIGESLAAEQDPSLTVTEMVGIAQLQATLALVEQQRIANLIALATSAGSPVLDVAARRALVRQNSEDCSDEIVPEIREGLGL